MAVGWAAQAKKGRTKRRDRHFVLTSSNTTDHIALQMENLPNKHLDVRDPTGCWVNGHGPVAAGELFRVETLHVHASGHAVLKCVPNWFHAGKNKS